MEIEEYEEVEGDEEEEVGDIRTFLDFKFL